MPAAPLPAFFMTTLRTCTEKSNHYSVSMELFSSRPTDKAKSMRGIENNQARFLQALKNAFPPEKDSTFSLVQAKEVYVSTFGHGVKDDHVARALSSMPGLKDLGNGEFGIPPPRTH
jgi:hypothetical protein